MSGKVFLIQICTVIYGKNYDEIRDKATQAISSGANLVEIRLDLCSNILELDNIPDLPVPIVLTNRSKSEGGKAENNTTQLFSDVTLLESDFD